MSEMLRGTITAIEDDVVTLLADDGRPFFVMRSALDSDGVSTGAQVCFTAQDVAQAQSVCKMHGPAETPLQSEILEGPSQASSYVASKPQEYASPEAKAALIGTVAAEPPARFAAKPVGLDSDIRQAEEIIAEASHEDEQRASALTEVILHREGASKPPVEQQAAQRILHWWRFQAAARRRQRQLAATAIQESFRCWREKQSLLQTAKTDYGTGGSSTPVHQGPGATSERTRAWLQEDDVSPMEAQQSATGALRKARIEA